VIGFYKRVDYAITVWMARNGVRLLRISLGIIFLWFGALKFFPGLSPATELAIRTIDVLAFGQIPSGIAINLLAAWETLIGLGLLTGIAMRATLALLFVQMLGTIAPVFLFPDLVFMRVPYAPTLEGQYIIKNVVLISAAIAIGATVRGGGLVASPVVARLDDSKR
jgi:uncharacterized membrane protein YkgB